jgi:hypothetical protein
MTNPPPITDLWAQPAPTHAVVVGKGPSLDRYDPDEYETWIKFAINEAVLAEPMGKPVRAHYMVFGDSVMRELKGVPVGTVPIRGQGHYCGFGELGYWYDSGTDFPTDAGGGTAGRVIVILGEWARRHLAQPMEVLLVGFDALDRPQGWTNATMYAKCLPQIVGRRGKNYTGVMDKMVKNLFMYRHDLVIRWFHDELAAQEYAAAVEP